MRTLKNPNREGIITTEVISGSDTEELKRETTILTDEEGGKFALTKGRALHLINRYTIAAAAAGIVPLPGADVLAVSALQADMVEEIAREYGLLLSPGWSKKIAVMLGGSMTLAVGARTVFSALKTVPVFGSVLGGGTSAVTSAVTTYAIGRAVAEHFGKGGTLNETMIPKLLNATSKDTGLSSSTATGVIGTTG